MSTLNPQAKSLNSTIQKSNSAVFSLLSDRGKRMFFPSLGIMAQSMQAKGSRINATIGIALDNAGTALNLPCISKHLKLTPKEVFPYSSSFGENSLRKLWRSKICKENPTLKSSQISMPLVTAGITHALSIAGHLFVDAHDEIILPDLFWGNYKLIFENIYGATLATYNTFVHSSFDTDGFDQKLQSGKSRKKIVLFNFPNNPSGYAPSEKEAEKLIASIKSAAESGNHIVVLVDDAYFGLVYEREVFSQSLFSHLSTLHKNVLAVKLDGATKEQFAWGLRVGFITFGCSGASDEMLEGLVQKSAGIVRASVSNASHLSQSLILKSLLSKAFKSEKKDCFTLLQQRYNIVCSILKSHPEYSEFFSPLPFNSGYFMCLQLQKKLLAEHVRKNLLSQHQIGVIAIKDKYLRIAFSSVPTKQIKTIFSDIYKVCKSLSVKKGK